jgi:hypothetical protein
MLANRADTYNLGDIIGGNADWFKASYIENAVTSNAVLAPLANKSQKDVRAFIRIAETGERETEGFEGSYSSRDVEEILSVMRKLVAIREVILKVNLEYIRSAAQADEFRTEPPFRLQGSYRNMNRLAEKVVAIMNDDEIHAMILDHYQNESQTLTTGAEANLLKFKELIGAMTEPEQARWEEIKKTFRRNQLVRGADGNDPVSRVVGQLSAFQSGLEAIQQTLENRLSREGSAPQVVVDLAPLSRGLEAIEAAMRSHSTDASPAPAIDLSPLNRSLEALRATVAEKLSQAADGTAAGRGDAGGLSVQLGEGLKALREDLSRAITAVHSGSMAEKVGSLSHEMEMLHSTLATLKDVAARQRDYLRGVEEMLVARAREGTVELELTQEMLTNERAFLDRFHQVLSSARQEPDAVTDDPSPGEAGHGDDAAGEQTTEPR